MIAKSVDYVTYPLAPWDVFSGGLPTAARILLNGRNRLPVCAAAAGDPGVGLPGVPALEATTLEQLAALTSLTRSSSIQSSRVVVAPARQEATTTTVNLEATPAAGLDVELLTGPGVAKLLNISLSEFHKLRKVGRMPLPLRFCRSPRWRRRELLAWIDAGMPHNSSWKWQKAS